MGPQWLGSTDTGHEDYIGLSSANALSLASFATISMYFGSMKLCGSGAACSVPVETRYLPSPVYQLSTFDGPPDRFKISSCSSSVKVGRVSISRAKYLRGNVTPLFL